MSIHEILSNGERRNIEFKSSLSEVHLEKDRRERLVSQMRYRLECGGGKAIYVLGVEDDGEVCGYDDRTLERTISVIHTIASEAGAQIVDIKKFKEGGTFAKLKIEKDGKISIKKHLIIGTIGHVDHGKSSLLGTLVTGIPDDGAGKTRIFSDFLPHEIERGLSAELSHLIFGFTSKGDPILLKNPLNKKEVASIVDKSYKFISFVDCPGHAPWLRTTIRGILGQKIDYALLVVSVDDSVTAITREHLGIVIAMHLPVFIIITKTDLATGERVREVEKDIASLLRRVGKVPYIVNSTEDIETAVERVGDAYLVPIMKTSCITRAGFSLLYDFLFRLPGKESGEDVGKPFLLYIDKVFKVLGAGTVVTGTVKEGIVKKGQELMVGPFPTGKFKTVRAISIMQHNFLQNQASVGDLIGVALKGVKPAEVRRGMVLSDASDLACVKTFEAEVLILNHPTRIKEGYEPIIHLNTIAESAIFRKIHDHEFLSTGDVARITFEFKYNPHCVRVGDRFLFRESRSKGIGWVLKVEKD